DHKYVGHLVAVVTYLVIALASMFGLEHDLLVYGSAPPWSYTEMRGFGGTLWPWLWFTAYWTAWAAVLLVVARLAWARGRECGVAWRAGEARRRFVPATAWSAAVAVALTAGIGVFV